MKKTRHRIFETNSSSTNTLSIYKNDDLDLFWNMLREKNQTISVGVVNYKKIEDLEYETFVDIGKLDFQTRLDLLFLSRFISYESVSFIGGFVTLISIFKSEKINVQIDVNYFVENESEFNWLLKDSDLLYYIKNYIKTKDDIGHFLSAEHGYFLSYEDDTTYNIDIDLGEFFKSYPKDKNNFIYKTDRK